MGMCSFNNSGDMNAYRRFTEIMLLTIQCVKYIHKILLNFRYHHIDLDSKNLLIKDGRKFLDTKLTH